MVSENFNIIIACVYTKYKQRFASGFLVTLRENNCKILNLMWKRKNGLYYLGIFKSAVNCLL